MCWNMIIVEKYWKIIVKNWESYSFSRSYSYIDHTEVFLKNIQFKKSSILLLKTMFLHNTILYIILTKIIYCFYVILISKTNISFVLREQKILKNTNFLIYPHYKLFFHMLDLLYLKIIILFFLLFYIKYKYYIFCIYDIISVYSNAWYDSAIYNKW